MLVNLTLHNWRIPIKQQHRIIQSLPQPFTIRDLDLALSELPAHLDSKRSDIAESLVHAWAEGDEITPINGPGITRYHIGRMAA